MSLVKKITPPPWSPKPRPRLSERWRCIWNQQQRFPAGAAGAEVAGIVLHCPLFFLSSSNSTFIYDRHHHHHHQALPPVPAGDRPLLPDSELAHPLHLWEEAGQCDSPCRGGETCLLWAGSSRLTKVGRGCADGRREGGEGGGGGGESGDLYGGGWQAGQPADRDRHPVPHRSSSQRQRQPSAPGHSSWLIEPLFLPRWTNSAS